jgi:hypothetical protein
LRQFRSEFLRLAIDAQQNAAGNVADGLLIVVFHQQRIERLGVGAQAKAKFCAGLRECGYG